MLSIGPPKHAENPIIGANTYIRNEMDGSTMLSPHTATLIFATRSAKELPTAKIVNPIIASESPKISPRV